MYIKVMRVGNVSETPQKKDSEHCMFIRVSHFFLDFKVSRYIEDYSFWSI